MTGIKIAYFDLDGTIVWENEVVSNRTVLALEYLKQKGIDVGFCTGRSYHLVKKFDKILKPNLPFICCNGAWIIDNQSRSTIFFDAFENEEFNKVLDFLSIYKLQFMVYTGNGFYTSFDHPLIEKRMLNDREKLSEDEKFDFQKYLDVDSFRKMVAIKVMILVKDSDQANKTAELIKRHLPQVTALVSENRYIEISKGGVDKLRGIEKVVKMLNIRKDNVLFFGDNNNDHLTIKTLKNAVALKNAKFAIKQDAKHVTELEAWNDGVAEFIFSNF